MTNKVKAIPEGYSALTPYLCVRDAARAIEFYKEVFGATELMRLDAPDGKVGHAELKIGDAPFMLGDECPEADIVSPLSLGAEAVRLAQRLGGMRGVGLLERAVGRRLVGGRR